MIVWGDCMWCFLLLFTTSSVKVCSTAHKHRQRLEVCYCFFFIISGQLPRCGEGWMAKQGNSANRFSLHLFINIKPVIPCVPDPPIKWTTPPSCHNSCHVTTHTPAEQKLYIYYYYTSILNQTLIQPTYVPCLWIIRSVAIHAFQGNYILTVFLHLKRLKTKNKQNKT